MKLGVSSSRLPLPSDVLGLIMWRRVFVQVDYTKYYATGRGQREWKAVMNSIMSKNTRWIGHTKLLPDRLWQTNHLLERRLDTFLWEGAVVGH